MYRSLTIFFGCTTALLAFVTAWLVSPQFQRANAQGRADEDIVFPEKIFVGAKAYVAAKGTLSADWIAYKNNAYSFICTQDECIVADVEQIGPKQMSSINGPLVYPMKRWTDDGEVVAEDNALCSRITITLDRRTKTVLWVETPINQTTIACKNSDDNIRKATLETSLYWRQSQGRTK